MKIFLLVFACMFLRSAIAQSQTHNKPALNRGVLIALQISKAGGEYKVVVKNITVAAGIKKGVQTAAGRQNSGALSCLILDKNEKVIDTLTILDPLQTRYEYPNEDGTIGSKIVQLKEKEILLRFAYDSGMKYIQVIESSATAKRRVLAKATLPEIKN